MNMNVVPLGDPAMHFWLTRSVARAMGVNLSQAMAAGKLTTQEYSDMVTHCRRCRFVTQCQNWLATEAVQRGEAYESCANRALLETLQAELVE